ncbi:hypothetical protein F5Y10DRAFT_26696 [Nemania abortiva]|nr:hypothetical protein F5Y10DRAFT_26696 [Nemania abortiva]
MPQFPVICFFAFAPLAPQSLAGSHRKKLSSIRFHPTSTNIPSRLFPSNAFTNTVLLRTRDDKIPSEPRHQDFSVFVSPHMALCGCLYFPSCFAPTPLLSPHHILTATDKSDPTVPLA